MWGDVRADANRSVVQHPFRRVVQVVELAVTHGLDEQHGENRSEKERDRQQKEDRVHVCPRLTDDSTRDEPHITIALDAGMRMAATRGLMRPAAAAVTATTL